MSDRANSTAKVRSATRLPQAKSADPGDQTERNFRYQHQYGVVLLIAVRRGARQYSSIYCEHHEDFLCELPGGLFDAYQIKTSRPEGGAWRLTSPALVQSIGRFVELTGSYPDQLGTFWFVSNSEVDSVTSASSNNDRRGRCPGLMIEHVRSCATIDAIEKPYKREFDALGAALGAEPVRLFDVLNRLEIVKGPSREEFDASLAHEHLAKLPECCHLTASQLGDVRDNLVAMFHRAASLHVTDPDRHLFGLFTNQTVDPAVTAKRIICADVEMAVPEVQTRQFAYQGEPSVNLGGARASAVLAEKLDRGGLSESLEYMNARGLAAEYHFLEEQAKNPTGAGHQLLQVEEAVHGECLEAFMVARTANDEPFGTAMFVDVIGRLRALEKDRKELLAGTPYEILMGMAALLTSDCRVWWSNRFRLSEGSK